MRKQRNHSFPKTYTTAGACYRARKVFEKKFEGQVFSITRDDGKYILNLDIQGTIERTKSQQEVVTETETLEIV